VNILFYPRTVNNLVGSVLTPSDRGTFAVQLGDGTYLSVQPNGELQTRTEIGPWERGRRIAEDLLQFEVEGRFFYLSIQEIGVAPTPPQPPIPEPGPYHAHHVDPGGPLTAGKAEDVVFACAQEFPQLLFPFNTTEEAEVACEEFLRRVIWHLQLVGFEAARQRNPSGVLSQDKLCVLLDAEWVAVDIMSMGSAGHATKVQWIVVTPADPVAEEGLAD